MNMHRVAQVIVLLVLVAYASVAWFGDARLSKSWSLDNLLQLSTGGGGGGGESDASQASGDQPPAIPLPPNSEGQRPRSSTTGAEVASNHAVEWPTLPKRRLPRQAVTTAPLHAKAFPENGPRMGWVPVECQPNSRYAEADDATRQIFREIIAHSEGLRETHDAAKCFFFGKGRWNETLDREQYFRDVEAVRSGKAGAEWTCTMEHLKRQDGLRMTYTLSDPKAVKAHKATAFGGHPRRVRFAEIHHPECALVNLRDPYSLLVALGSLRGGGMSNTHTAIEIMGDSIHRGMFNTIVAMLRGTGERAYFDRQAHRNLRYVVHARGDLFWDGAMEPPEDTLLEVTYHAVFGYQFESIPPGLRYDSRGATVIVTGGLEHAEFDCNTRQPRVDALLGYVAKITKHIKDGMTENLARFENNLKNTTLLTAVVKEGALFPQPPTEALIVFKAGIQPSSMAGAIMRGYHAMRNHLYRGVVDDMHVEKMRALASRRTKQPAHSLAQLRAVGGYASAAPGMLFLDEIKLLNFADEGTGKVDVVKVPYGPLNVAGAKGAGVANASSLLDPETTPSDGLHSTCTMHYSLPERVGGWYLQHSTCRGWRERGNIQLFASMIVATARARYEAESLAARAALNSGAG